MKKSSEPGGLLRTAIPEFTLPKSAALRLSNSLVASGVTFIFNQDISMSQLEDLKSKYDAIIVAVGAQEPLKLDVPGANLKGIVDSIDFFEKADNALRKKKH